MKIITKTRSDKNLYPIHGFAEMVTFFPYIKGATFEEDVVSNNICLVLKRDKADSEDSDTTKFLQFGNTMTVVKRKGPLLGRYVPSKFKFGKPSKDNKSLEELEVGDCFTLFGNVRNVTNDDIYILVNVPNQSGNLFAVQLTDDSGTAGTVVEFSKEVQVHFVESSLKIKRDK